MRVLEIAKKLKLKENKYCLDKLPKWIDDSKQYAEKMIAQYGFNNAQSTEEGYRLLYIMNHLCPNLHHFHKKPNFRIIADADVEEWNRLMDLYIRENSQASFRNAEGEIVQEGIKYTKEEYYVFIEAINANVSDKTKLITELKEEK